VNVNLHRPGFTRPELLLTMGLLAMLLILCVAPDILRLPAPLLFGWGHYIGLQATQLVIDWPNTWTFLGCLAALTLGIHLVGRSMRPENWRWRFSGVIVGILVLGFLAGIAMLSIAHQVVWLATTEGSLLTPGRLASAANRTLSIVNCREITRGAHSYHDRHHAYPAGSTFDLHGSALHSWQTLLLPYIEQPTLYDAIDLKRPWNHPSNLPAIGTLLPFYNDGRARKVEGDGPAPTTYSASVHVLNAVPITMKDITDGTSNTLLLGEAADHFKAWAQPLNWRDPLLGLNTSPEGFGHPRGTGVVFCFVDGHARTIAADISPAVLMALSTPAAEDDPGDWAK
jgi:hypothetical protein